MGPIRRGIHAPASIHRQPSHVKPVALLLAAMEIQVNMTVSHDEVHDQAIFARLAQKIAPGATLLRAWMLHGGVSARVTALEIQHADGHIHKLTVRQHGAADIARDPGIAANEYALLQALHNAGLPVPQPCILDQSGELFATPVVVSEYIEGETVSALTDAPDFIAQMVAHLALIHQVDYHAPAFAVLPKLDETCATILSNHPATLDTLLEEERIRDTLEAAWPWPRQNTSRLLHGDYWPGNILWRDGRLVGIIDWEDAAIGDPLADLAITRLDLLWAYSMDAMRSFTDAYAATVPVDLSNLPYWDLCAALRPAGRLGVWAPDAAAEARMRELHHLFVAQALDRLPVG